MLREENVLKFVKDSSVMRHGHYIGIDIRNKLIILGICGTHTVYDLITDIVSSSHREVTFEGYSTHFGTGEAARWFIHHEIGTIRKCLEEYEGFRLRLVVHSLGGATAVLLALMLRKKKQHELGFNPDIVSAVGLEPNFVVYNTFLKAMGKAGKPGLARSLFNEMIDAGLTPNRRHVHIPGYLNCYGKTIRFKA